jgi:hypothetical protein
MSEAHRIRWAKGGEALVVRLDGDAITLRSTTPSPPGSRIEGSLAPDPDATWSGDDASSGVDRAALRADSPSGEAVSAGRDLLRVKIHSSKKQEDGSFLLEGRALDLTRALRDRLKAQA